MIKRVLTILFFSIFFINLTSANPADFHLSGINYPFENTINCLVRDSDGFLWIGTPQGLYRFDGFEFELINTVSNNGFQLTNSNVQHLMEDSAGKLWIGTSNGLNIFNSERTKIEHFLSNAPQNTNIHLIRQFDDQVWIGTESGSLLTTPIAERDLKKEEDISRQFKILRVNAEKRITGITSDASGNKFVTSEGMLLIKLNAVGKEIERIKLDFIGQSVFYDRLLDKLLISSRFGIYQVDPFLNNLQLRLELDQNEATLLKLYQVADDDYLLFSGSKNLFYRYQSTTNQLTDYAPAYKTAVKSHQHLIHDLVKSPQGFILGTNRGLVGIDLIPPYFTNFPRPDGIKEQDLFSVRKIFRLDKNHLLIGGYRGTFIYNEQRRLYQPLIYHHSSDRKPLGYDFIRTSNQVLMATEGHGLLILDLDSQLISPLITDQQYQLLPKRFNPSKWSISIFKDSRNQVWLGSYGGVYKANLAQKELEVFLPGGKDVFAQTWIYDIAEDLQGNLWFATKKGLFSYQINSDSLRRHPISNIAWLETTSMIVDQDIIWAGSQGEGLKQINLESGTFQTYTTREGLCDNYISSMVKAPSGKIWISTNNGLSCFDPPNERFSNFYEEDGLPSNIFNHKASLIDDNGEIYFGGYNGLFRVNRENFASFQQEVPKVKVSKFSEHRDKYDRIHTNIFNAHQESALTIPQDDQFFTISFSTDILDADRLTFTYQIPGIHKSWQELKSRNFIHFAAIPPGNYQLQVKASYDGGPLSDPLLLNIKVNQAFYLTWWAYLIYLVIIFTILFLGIRLYYKKQQIQHKLGVEKLVTNKLLDLDKTKSRFFTNFAHEIRTPLNLINAPATELLQMTRSPHLQGLSRQILSNAEVVETLLTQILQLNKLESGRIELNKENTDLVGLMKNLIERFRQLSIYKRIGMEFNSEYLECIVEVDSEKFKNVMNNLISNAFKFTDSGGEVIISIAYTPPDVEIRVQDNGIGIPKPDITQIFDRYFQSEGNEKQGGMGIGLSYVKELVLAHGGQVQVESEEKKGSNFIINLPLVSFQLVDEFPLTEKTNDHQTPDSVTANDFHSEKPRMLIIEDHHELAAYMIRHMEQQFTILHAVDGNQALNEIRHFNPEVIITDLMLPKMDGITLINRLKADQKTKDIPIIILSAKDNVETKIEGYREGAILYLTKPFQVEELKLAAENLVNNQRIKPKKLEFPVMAQETFYQKFLDLVDQHLADPDFTINQMVKLLGTSRTQLHRKLKKLTGHSPLLIIKSIKMEKSYQMLKQGKTIKEVTYATGYSSTSQFGKTFKEFFGKTPLEVKKGIGKDQNFETKQ